MALAPSLVACLRFAAPLVRSDANPQSVCVKATLGAMVVDAHRLAQQATSQQIDHRDPRRLLTKIRSLDDQLSRLSFNDITWDSEGIAVQSLEMELQDLEERANASLLGNFCVLLTASDGAEDAAEAALLWFPRADEHGNNGSKKYLLYAVPGRIKIVKNLAELLKKMTEEIATIRSLSATYQVWTLIEAKEGRKKKAEVASAVTSSAHTVETMQEPNSGPDLHQAKQQDTPELDMMDTEVSRVMEPACEHRPVRIRVREKDLVEHPSIFNFVRVEHVSAEESTSQRLEVSQNDPSDATLSLNAEVRSDDSVGSASTIAQESSPSPMPALRSATDIRAEEVCGSPVTRVFGEKDASKRKEVLMSHVQALQKLTDGELVDHNEDRSCKSREGLIDASPLSVSASHATKAHTSSQATTQAVGPQIRPLPGRDHGETIFQFSSSRLLQPPTSCDCGHSCDNARPVQSEANEIPDKPQSFISGTDLAHVDGAVSGEIGDATKPKKKKRSARDHYRSKLGARGWWELEYQATKILQQQYSGHTVAATVGRGYPFTKTDQSTKQSNARAHDYSARVCSTESGEDEQHCRLTTAPRAVAQAPVQQMNISASVDGTSVRADNSINDTVCRCRTDDLPFAPHATPTLPSSMQSIHHQHAFASLARSLSPRPETGHGLSGTSSTGGRTESLSAEVLTTRDEALLCGTSRIEVSLTASRGGPVRNASETLVKMAPPVDPSSPVSTRVDHTIGELAASNANRFRATSAIATARIERQDEDRHVVASRFRGSALHKHEDEDHDTVLTVTVVSHNHHIKGFEADSFSRQRDPTRFMDSPTKEKAPSGPFHSQGHVPIRQRQNPKPRQWVATAESDNGVIEFPTTIESTLDIAVPTKPHVPPVVATFTTRSPVSDATQRARQQKLAELRQKKIQQLQKARDDAVGKKHKPHAAHGVPEPISLAASAAAPPPTHGGAGDSTMGVRKPSNRKLVENAIAYTLLAGGSLERERQAALLALRDSPCDNFIVLLKSAKELKFRALYEHHVERRRVVRIFSVASSSPPVLTDDVISQFFRYNSGKKEFTAIDGREFTLKTDACALVDQLVFKKKVALGRLL